MEILNTGSIRKWRETVSERDEKIKIVWEMLRNA